MDKGKYFRIERTLESLGFTSFYDYLAGYISENQRSIYKQYSSSERLAVLSAKELQDITIEAYHYYSIFPAGTKDNQACLSANHKTLFGGENLKKIYDSSLKSDKSSLPRSVVNEIQKSINTQANRDKVRVLIQQCKKFNPEWERDEIIQMLENEMTKICMELFR